MGKELEREVDPHLAAAVKIYGILLGQVTPEVTTKYLASVQGRHLRKIEYLARTLRKGNYLCE